MGLTVTLFKDPFHDFVVVLGFVFFLRDECVSDCDVCVHMAFSPVDWKESRSLPEGAERVWY